MVIKFYSYWTPILSTESTSIATAERTRDLNNERTQDLANELNTVLGNNELISMTSSATNGIVITTIAYETNEEE